MDKKFLEKLEKYKEAYGLLEVEPEKTVSILEECISDEDYLAGHYFDLLATAYISLGRNDEALRTYDLSLIHI